MDRLWARVERMKHQSPNTKLQRNSKLQIPKPVAGSLPWSLGLGATLEFGVWWLELELAEGFPLSPLLRRGERESTAGLVVVSRRALPNLHLAHYGLLAVPTASF